jgi:hypothetical protein
MAALAEKEKCSVSQVSVWLCFGRFLNSVPDRPPTLTLNRFRSAWSRSGKNLDEPARFSVVVRLFAEDAAVAPPQPRARRLGLLIVERFADGIWRGLDEIAAAVEGNVIAVDYTLTRMVTTGAYHVKAERRRLNDLWQYKIEKGQPTIPLAQVLAKLAPIVEELEGSLAAARLQAILDVWVSGEARDHAELARAARAA